MKKLLKITLTVFFTTILLLGFAVPLNPVGNWYQQFVTNLGGRQIADITFTDSLNGCIISNRLSATDSTLILRSTDKGDNWFKVYNDSGVIYTKLQFINQSTGFIGGYIYKGGTFKLVKTTNGGINWFYFNAPFDVPVSDLYAIDENNIWLASSSSFNGGVYRTTNGGTSWDHPYFTGSNHPVKIYMYNNDTGFIAVNGTGGYVRRTTNSGVSWSVAASGEGFYDMHFVNGLTGYRSYSNTMKKTTDGGMSWVSQSMPQGGQIITSSLTKFSLLNKDTILGVGGQIFYGGSQTRGIVYRTINGGNNWQYQTPDTAYNLFIFEHIKFTSNSNGWAYSGPRGVHTTNGGDPVWFTGIIQISSEVPNEYKLYQNYPNPFNPKTNIKYQITKNNSIVRLTVFDITGREIVVLVNQKQNAGTYEVDFSGNGLASGVYFYRIEAEELNGNKFVDSKKMVLLK